MDFINDFQEKQIQKSDHTAPCAEAVYMCLNSGHSVSPHWDVNALRKMLAVWLQSSVPLFRFSPPDKLLKMVTYMPAREPSRYFNNFTFLPLYKFSNIFITLTYHRVFIPKHPFFKNLSNLLFIMDIVIAEYKN